MRRFFVIFVWVGTFEGPWGRSNGSNEALRPRRSLGKDHSPPDCGLPEEFPICCWIFSAFPCDCVGAKHHTRVSLSFFLFSLLCVHSWIYTFFISFRYGGSREEKYVWKNRFFGQEEARTVEGVKFCTGFLGGRGSWWWINGKWDWLKSMTHSRKSLGFFKIILRGDPMVQNHVKFKLSLLSSLGASKKTSKRLLVLRWGFWLQAVAPQAHPWAYFACPRAFRSILKCF